MRKFALKNLLVLSLALCCAVVIGGTAVPWMGTTYTVPSVGESDWAGPTKVDGLLISIGTNAFSKAGGTFTLQADANFGSSYGLLSKYFTDNVGNAATAGAVRLSNGSSIEWRNYANSGNLVLSTNSSDALTYQGSVLASSSGIVPATAGGTGQSSYTTGDTLYANGSTSLTKLNIGGSSTLYVSTGTAPQWAHVMDSMVDVGASVSRSKLAVGTAGHVVINESGTGVMSSEATLATSRGGTNISSYTTGDLLYASNSSTISKLGIGSSGQKLTVSGGLPSWGSASESLSVANKTSAYTLTGTDDVIVSNGNGASITYTLPSASANSGKVFYLSKAETAGTTNISTIGGDRIGTSQTVTLGRQDQVLGIVSDGSSVYRVISRGPGVGPTQTRLTSGSGTYTTPPGVLYLKIKMVGGGGGSSGSDSSTGDGGAGGNTTFGSSLLTCNGGAGGTTANAVSGGSATINPPAFGIAIAGSGGTGSSNGAGSNNFPGGPSGGTSPFGGAGAGGSGAASGQAAQTNSGSGGGADGGSNAPGGYSGGAGAAGGYIEATINNPSATYAYSVGAAGSAGGNGQAGGSGVIIVDEYYQ